VKWCCFRLEAPALTLSATLPTVGIGSRSWSGSCQGDKWKRQLVGVFGGFEGFVCAMYDGADKSKKCGGLGDGRGWRQEQEHGRGHNR
jgi:hypothetical protein